MLLVRRRSGIAYFLAHDREEDRVLFELAQRFPGSPVAIVERREGLMLLRVGQVPGDDAGQPGGPGERFAIVGLTMRSGLTPVPAW